MTTTETRPLGISEVAEVTGVTAYTLRWYEKEGLLPAVERLSDGRRAYSEATLNLVRLVQVLRRTGMPVADVRRFVTMIGEGAASHGRRSALLQEQRTAIQRQLVQLRADLELVDAKIAHYDGLIDAGLDCGGAPVDEQTRLLQQAGLPVDQGPVDQAAVDQGAMVARTA